MVRIVSQNFSPQRSRHSSGETDKYLADRASLALGLSGLGKKRLDLPECESSSDSFWDSELDGEHHDTVYSECGEDNNDINGNETLKKSNAQSKRKERRRERNKISAQAYRQRRRSQNMKEQQELHDLETENKRLHQLVETLQKKTEQFKQTLRGHPVPMPGLRFPSSGNGATAARAPSTTNIDLSNTNSPDANSNLHFFSDSKDASPSSHLSHHSTASAAAPVMSNVNLAMSMSSPSPGMDESSASGASPSCTTAAIAVNSIPHTQILVNSNAVMKSHMQHVPVSAATVPTFALPAVMAIPLEYSSAATNHNLNSQPQNLNGKAHPAISMQNSPPPNKCSHLVSGNAPVVGAIMWSFNSNPPPHATVYSLMNVEMCNNKNMDNTNLNSVYKQSMSGCDNKPSGAVPGSPVTVNLNEVQISGEPLKFWHAH